MKRAKGFCDLNIPNNSNLKETVLHACKLGYKTIAINTEVTDTKNCSDSKKGKKKGL